MRKIIDSKIFKIIYGTFKGTIITVLVLYVSFLAFQRFSDNGSIGGYRMFTIVTGSMEPEYTIGDVILVEETKYEELKLNIVFISE